MRALYSLVWWLALPLVLLRLWWRGRKEPGYRRHIAERLGFYSLSLPQHGSLIWIHAVSVGETRAAEPLIDALLSEYPDDVILLTHMTATGRDTGAELFGARESRIVQSFLPYDTSWMMSRFLRHFSPRLCILMETEIWPNLMEQCTRHHIPAVLVNARMSERSLARARFASGLMLQAAGKLTCVAAQTHADAARLRQYGAQKVEVTGSVKFDVTPSETALALAQSWQQCFGQRPVLLCASTRDGEEEMLLDALPSLDIPNALVAIVPRHPQRFDDVEQLIVERNLSMLRRSELDENAPFPAGVQILLGDSMGEMFAYYAAADVAFIGGSLLRLGGQNLIEACAVGTPVLVGPHTFNFAAITEDAIAADAAIRVESATEVMRQAGRLLQDAGLRAQMGADALAFAQRQRGATERAMTLLRPLLKHS